jgi:hypothetical protein
MENKIEIYTSADNRTEVKVVIDESTVWLTQQQMVLLFDSSKAIISEHIKNIFNTEELDHFSTVRKFRTVQKERTRMVSREREHYNLDMIISICYRVNSKQGVKFRQWATQRLKEYLVQGLFVDGNKRIAAACFLYFLEKNNALFNTDGTTIIDNNTLAALTLFIAASKSQEADIVKRFAISILNRSKNNLNNN